MNTLKPMSLFCVGLLIVAILIPKISSGQTGAVISVPSEVVAGQSFVVTARSLEDMICYWDIVGQQHSGCSVSVVVEEAGEHSISSIVIVDDVLVEQEYLVTVVGSQEYFDTSGIIFTELLPNPQGSDAAEWIELYNMGDQEVVLQDWSVQDASGKIFYFQNKATIAPDEYMVLYRDETTIALNNTTETVKLFSPDTVERDRVEYFESAKDDTSWALFDNEWQWTESPTPGLKNRATMNSSIDHTTENVGRHAELDVVEDFLEEENVDLALLADEVLVFDEYEPVQIELSELFPAPEGDDRLFEYIELYNPNAFSVDLSGWMLTDTKQTYVFDAITIQGHEYLVVERADSKIALNNDGDTLLLVDPIGDVVSATVYGRAEPQMVWSVSNGDWQWSVNLTPGERNVIDTDLYTERVAEVGSSMVTTQGKATVRTIADTTNYRAIATITDEVLAQSVVVQGYVTVQPNIFGKQILYMADETGGIQLYMHSANWPNLERNQFIKVRGEVSKAYGEYRIKIAEPSAISILSDQQAQIPTNQTVTVLDESVVGSVVIVNGKVLSVTKDAVTLVTKELAEIVVRIAAIDTTAMPIIVAGDDVSITGIVRRRDAAMYLYARDSADIVLNTKEQKSIPSSTKPLAALAHSKTHDSQSIIWTVAYALVIICIGVFGFLLYTLKRQTIRNY